MRGPAIRAHAEEEGVDVAVRETQHCKHEKEHKQLVGKGQEEGQKERERETGRHGPDEIRAKGCVLLGTGRRAERKREETKRHGPEEIRAKGCLLLGTGRRAERKREVDQETRTRQDYSKKVRARATSARGPQNSCRATRGRNNAAAATTAPALRGWSFQLSAQHESQPNKA